MKLKISLALCLIIVVAGSLSACNTVEGFGKDVKGLGQSMENAASKKTGN